MGRDKIFCESAFDYVFVIWTLYENGGNLLVNKVDLERFNKNITSMRSVHLFLWKLRKLSARVQSMVECWRDSRWRAKHWSIFYKKI